MKPWPGCSQIGSRSGNQTPAEHPAPAETDPGRQSLRAPSDLPLDGCAPPGATIKNIWGSIRAVTFLHQYQRPKKTAAFQGRTIEYIEVTLNDIDLANRLASEVLGHSLDENGPGHSQTPGTHLANLPSPDATREFKTGRNASLAAANSGRL